MTAKAKKKNLRTEVIACKVTPELKKKIEEKAEHETRTISNAVVHILETYFRNKK